MRHLGARFSLDRQRGLAYPTPQTRNRGDNDEPCALERGRCFVVETTRFNNGVPDTRNFMHWLDDDIGARSVADRLAMYERHNYKGFEKFDAGMPIYAGILNDSQIDSLVLYIKSLK